MKNFVTNKGRNARLVSQKMKYVNGHGWKIQVEIDGEWKTVVSRCYGGNSTIDKVKAEY